MPRGLNDEEQQKYEDLVAAGFSVVTEYDGRDDEFLFHVVTPEGKPIGPMNDREVFWMLEGYKAGNR